MYESLRQADFEKRWNIAPGDPVSIHYWEDTDPPPEYMHEPDKHLEFFDGVYQGFPENSLIMFLVSGRLFHQSEIDFIGRAKKAKRKAD